jgi:ribonuclease III
MNLPVEALEEKLGYRFRNQKLLIRALTHRSWLSERASQVPENGDNEQLEFLGDAILGFVVSEVLVSKHPSAQEGELSRWKSHLVSASHLYSCAIDLGLGEFLLMGRGEERSGGRERKTLLANAIEALIAALHLDAGIEVARRFIEEHVLSQLENRKDFEALGLMNHKSILQERTQALGLPPPRYSIVATSGPEHAKIFTVEARVGEAFAKRGCGTSKKAASQRAAELLIQELNASLKSEVETRAT